MVAVEDTAEAVDTTVVLNMAADMVKSKSTAAAADTLVKDLKYMGVDAVTFSGEFPRDRSKSPIGGTTFISMKDVFSATIMTGSSWWMPHWG
jgi:hypothetical protein